MSNNHSYTVEFCDFKIDNGNNEFYLVDEFFKPRIRFPENRTVFIQANEAKKDLESLNSVLIGFSDLGMKRSNRLIVVGGGFVQDIGTLASSVYMRGIDWEFFPSTLASMGDSCLGGKSSINAGSVKNLIGNFYPPTKIKIDIEFTNTLPEVELVAGFSEIVKICFARGPVAFNQVLDLIQAWEESPSLIVLKEIVQLSLISKKYFVEIDEFDTGVRKLLNFGHSFGHAIEASCGFRISHGVAVLVGMLAATYHSSAKHSVETDRLSELILRLLSKVSDAVLPSLEALDYSVFLEALLKDKKNSTGALNLIIPNQGQLEIMEFDLQDGALDLARQALQFAIRRLFCEIR
jgi:3-dehydroquinate synthase